MQRFLVLAFLAILGMGPVEAQTLKDNFDGNTLDKTKWTVKQIRDDQIAFPAAGRCGAGIEIIVRESDGGNQCATDCQRAELRTIRTSWPTFGDEVWYRFSFRVSGDIAEIGSRRFVISQWKGPGDGSPMLAQRFDNGIFHITVQDNDIRHVIASAEGDPDAILSAQQELAKPEPTDAKTVTAAGALQSRDQVEKARPKLSQKQKDGLSSEPPKGVDEQQPVQDLPAVAYVTGPERNLGNADIEITPELNATLPDPRKAWVDMVYRVKPGRTDNEYGPRRPGEIDVWANGRKIVSVEGNIGATLKRDNPLPLKGPYFKFGIYRLRQPGTVQFSFDEFSQAPTRDTLPGLCKAN
jgi:hypothetical protein